MNSGCAVVASHAIGSVPFMIKHNNNGIIYKNGDLDDFYIKTRNLIDDKEKQIQLGKNAYSTLKNMWNAKIVSERFLKLAKEISKQRENVYDEGPCSYAIPIKQKEMYNIIVNKNSSNNNF